MFGAMKRIKSTVTTLGTTTLLVGVCASLWADTKVNPYEAIAERNPFNLKEPPPPDPDAGKPPPPPPPPLATVDLTGITSILGPPRALLEIVPGPGKPMIKPVLSEGERVESVEVVSINVEKNEVVIKNGNITTNLTFKVAKSTGTQPPPGGALPGAVPKPGVPVPQPTQTSYNNPNYNQGSGRYNVMMAGGAGSEVPPAGNANPAYGVNPNTANLTGGADGSFRSIPSRNLRANPQTPAPTMSPEEQVIMIEANEQMNRASGRIVPPLPPTPLNPTRNVVLPPLPGQTYQK